MAPVLASRLVPLRPAGQRLAEKCSNFANVANTSANMDADMDAKIARALRATSMSSQVSPSLAG